MTITGSQNLHTQKLCPENVIYAQKYVKICHTDSDIGNIFYPALEDLAVTYNSCVYQAHDSMQQLLRESLTRCSQKNIFMVIE